MVPGGKIVSKADMKNRNKKKIEKARNEKKKRIPLRPESKKYAVLAKRTAVRGRHESREYKNVQIFSD